MKNHENTEKDFLTLTLTEEQAKVVSKACEFYARIRMGQFNEIIWNTLDPSIETENFCLRRDSAEEFLLKARKEIYPDLNGFGHSYGIGKFKDADLSFDVYQVLRNIFGDDRGNFSYYKLPKVELIQNKEG